MDDNVRESGPVSTQSSRLRTQGKVIDFLAIGLILVVGMLALLMISLPAQGKTITVDDDGGADYDTIQDAVDAAETGDTIRIYEGHYGENIAINTTLSLIGNGTGLTVVEGDGSGAVISVYKDWCNISQLSVTGSRLNMAYDAGIRITSSHTSIDNVESYDNYEGMHIGGGEYNNVTDCSLHGNQDAGLYLIADRSTIRGNTIYNNDRRGIMVHDGSYNLITENSCYQNFRGIVSMEMSRYNSYIGNTCFSNDIDGIMVYFSPRYITIEQNECWNNEKGIYILESVSHFSVRENDCHDNEIGISIGPYSVNNITVTDNEVHDNEIGIHVDEKYATDEVFIKDNSISGNINYGLEAMNNDETLDITYNWWGSNSGPYHETENPEGRGDNVTGDVLFDPWEEREGYEEYYPPTGFDFYVDDSAPNGGDGSVDSPFTLIMDAVDASNYGDRIFVLEGEYHECIILKDGIQLISQPGNRPFLNGSDICDLGEGKVIIKPANHTLIQGFLFAYGDLGFLNGGMKDVTIDGNIFTNLRTGIHNYDGAQSYISNNVFQNLQYGVYSIKGTVGMKKSNDTIVNNVFDSMIQYGIYGPNGIQRILNNIFVDCQVAVGHCKDLQTYKGYNIFWNNTEDYFDCISGVSDIYSDPLFMDSDYHIGPTSPALDSGTESLAPDHDAENDPRPNDGNGDGTFLTDRGIDEHHPILYVDDSTSPGGNGTIGHPFNSINDALNASKSGNTIRVFSGEYHENITIYHTLRLIGNGSSSTIINGTNFGNVITINGNGVSISGISIVDNGTSWYYGVEVKGVDTSISDCEIYGHYYGIYVTGNSAIIRNNDVSYNGVGIQLVDSVGHLIQNNVCEENEAKGIQLQNASTSELDGNEISGSRYGISMLSSDHIDIRGNIVVSNSYGGPTFHYPGYIFYYIGVDGGLYIYNVSDSTIVGNNFSWNPLGMKVHKTTNTLIFENIMQGNIHGFHIENSSNNMLHSNSINENNVGMVFWDDSWDNSVRENFIFDNDKWGLTVSWDGNETLDAALNYWGHASGPYHAVENPEGLGDNVTDKVDFSPWLNEEGGTTLFVDDDAPEGGDGTEALPFNRIQDALDISVNGSMIYVLPGTYYENLVIRTQVTLVGSGAEVTSIIGDGTSDVIFVNESYVSVSGLTVSNAGNGDDQEFAGIRVGRLTNRIQINDNIIRDNEGAGIILDHNSYITIISNFLDNNTMGIFVGSSHRNEIVDTVIQCSETSNLYGIEVYQSNLNIIHNTSVISGKGGKIGISLGNGSKWNTLTSITIKGMETYGIYLDEVALNDMINCTFENNSIGIYVNKHDYDYQMSELFFQYCLFEDNAYGMYILDAYDSEILNCTFMNNTKVGVQVWDSNYLIFRGNSFEMNTVGINVSSSSYDMEIRYNDFKKNVEYGVNVFIIYGIIYEVDARYNNWGDNTGPHHSLMNPAGAGDEISDNVEFIPWNFDTTTTNISVLYGFVMDYLSGDPIPEANISISCTSELSATSDGEGYYFILDIPTIYCVWNITVSAPEYVTRIFLSQISDAFRWDFPLVPIPKENERPGINITSPLHLENLTAPITINGTSWDNDGSVESVEYRLNGDSWFLLIDTTPTEYHISLGDLANGTYTVSVRSYDGEDYSPIVSVTFTVIMKEIKTSEDDGFHPGPIILAATVVTVGALAVAGLAYTREDTRYLLFALVVLPLYSKLGKDEIFKNNNRKEVFSFIQENPGSNYSRLLETLSMGNGTLVHHLSVLMREGMIKSKSSYGRKLFYADPNYTRDKKLRSLPPISRTEQIILESLQTLGPAARAEIEETLKIPIHSVNESIRLLKERELIGSDGDGKWSFCWALDGPKKKS